VIRGADPHLAVALGKKFLPLIVMVKARPAIAVAGLRLVMAGGGSVMVNAAVDELPAAVITVTLAVPGVAIRLAGIAAVNLVALM
jgi:hypothetical protein